MRPLARVRGVREHGQVLGLGHEYNKSRTRNGCERQSHRLVDMYMLDGDEGLKSFPWQQTVDDTVRLSPPSFLIRPFVESVRC